ncbi:hypothetical protein J6590_080234 [Homalodisca vitripennis]|nr:hypothetical protein J6590_080234 [Homalodisca vitripennis]
MPKTNSETSKYPCGVCSIGVRYSGIICTGSCSQWYHGGCVNISDKRLKKLTQDEIKTWACENCKTSMIAQNGSMSELTFVAIGESELFPTFKTPSPSGYHKVKANRNTVKSDLELSLSAVKTKVRDQEGQEEDDPETSLALAAEVGSLLLAENLELKKDVEDLNIRNSALEAKLSEMEATLEDRTEAEEKYLHKIEALGIKLQEAIAQITKEKQNRQELQNFYEEHDTRQTLIYDEQANKISELEQTILNLKREKSGQRDLLDKNQQDSKKFKNVETQTIQTATAYTITPSSPTPVAQELAKLGKKLDYMELSVTLLNDQIKQHNCTKDPQALIDSQTSSSTKRLRTHKLNTSKIREIQGKIKNQFSVSLKVVKSKQALITTTEQTGNLPGVDTANYIHQTPQANSITNNDKNQILVEAQMHQPDSYSPPKLLKKSSRLTQESIAVGPTKPPVTAQKLEDGETYEKFFEKNIEHIKIHTRKGGNNWKDTDDKHFEDSNARQIPTTTLHQHCTIPTPHTINEAIDDITIHYPQASPHNTIPQANYKQPPITATKWEEGQTYENLLPPTSTIGNFTATDTKALQQSYRRNKIYNDTQKPNSQATKTREIFLGQNIHKLDFKKITNTQLTVLHQNICGLGKKVDRLNHILNETQPNLVILTEHGLKKEHLRSTQIENYSLLAEFSRQNHKLGGVAIYVKQPLVQRALAIDVSHLCQELCCEAAMTKVKCMEETIYFLGIYRSPKESAKSCINSLSNILVHIEAHNKPVVIWEI